jgi:hypothetical protein
VLVAKRLTVMLFVALLTGCSFVAPAEPCANDDDCADDEVCGVDNRCGVQLDPDPDPDPDLADGGAPMGGEDAGAAVDAGPPPEDLDGDPTPVLVADAGPPEDLDEGRDPGDTPGEPQDVDPVADDAGTLDQGRDDLEDGGTAVDTAPPQDTGTDEYGRCVTNQGCPDGLVCDTGACVVP